MASQVSSPSISGQGSGSDGSKNQSRKSNITRVRTGCFTCRRRRKKCDERRPVCENCQRTNVFCEGFPQQVFWGENRSVARRAVTSRSDSNVSTLTYHVPPSSTTGVSEDNTDFAQWPEPLPPQFSTGYQGQVMGHLEDRLLGDEMGFMIEQMDISPMAVAMNLTQGTGSGDYQGVSHQLATRQETSREISLSQNAPQDVFIPVELPFLISGIDTTIHQRLFCHFTGVLSQLLTILPGQSNPFNQVVIPMALGDQNVMDTLLCLSGSHLLKKNPSVPDTQLMTEKRRLHQNAVNTQELRVGDLRKSAMGRYPIQYQETVLATSLLLCLFEICEGTGDGSWKSHLEIAREIITMASETSSTSSRTININPFLLEFFLYHDSLATVTSPSNPVMKPQFRNLAELPDKDISLVGVQDGLIEFIIQISALRADADASEHQPDGNVVVKAVQIWQDLAKWKPKSSTGITKQRRLITEFYQWALFIWLYSIIYPNRKAEAKVQNAVRRIAEGMNEINSGDGVMACLLFPLFVVGSAAISSKDRDMVESHFMKLRNWSALGNIDLTEKLVRKMWKDHDEGLPGSWDWVKQLETHGMSLLVT